MYLGKNTNVTKAIKDAIDRYMLKNELERVDVAITLGIVKGTLDNKLKLSMPVNSFTVEEVLKLSEVMDDDAILKAMCNERGLTAFDPIEAMADGGDVVSALMMGILEINTHVGKLATLSKDAAEDGKIDENEAEAIGKVLKVLRAVERKLELTLKNGKDVF